MTYTPQVVPDMNEITTVICMTVDLTSKRLSDEQQEFKTIREGLFCI